MPAEEFKEHISSDEEFSKRYNHEFRMPQNTCLDLLGIVSSVLPAGLKSSRSVSAMTVQKQQTIAVESSTMIG